jgi:ABC-type bacteriocin/lantibiotic exporter with double-glycine peptidase domain
MPMSAYAGRVVLAVCVSFCSLRTVFGQHCGARAVSRILQDLEMPPADLATLIKELNGADGGSTPSFPMLADALRRRRVAAVFVALDALPALDSKRPAILHVDGNHFAVYEGCAEGKHFVWWGPGSQRPMSWEEIERTASRSVLLVGREPPDEMQKTVIAEYRRSRPTHYLPKVLHTLTGAALCLTGWLFVLGSRRRRSADLTRTFLQPGAEGIPQ